MKGIKRECYRQVQAVVCEENPYCVWPRCGKKTDVGHHIFPRARMGTAFDPDAILPLCNFHHQEAHHDPNKAEEVARIFLGDRRYENLMDQSREVVRLREADFRFILGQLKKRLDKKDF